MRRLALLLLAPLCATLLAACSSCPSAPKMAAAPQKRSLVYTPPCAGGNYARPEGDEVYTPSDCGNFFESLVDQFSQVRCPARGIGIPGLDCTSPAPSSVSLHAEAPPVAAAHPTCDPAALPKDAKPGDVWCCTEVRPPAGPPVKVAEAREEWQRIDCGPGAGECWTKVVIPPVFSAPPPPPSYWEWRLNPACKAPEAPRAAPPCLPAVPALKLPDSVK